MDPLILTIVTRAFERLLVVFGGGLAIYLGYRLFLDMPQAERGSGKVNLPGGISIYLSRVGPGIFFSLFGAAVIGLSFHYGISFSDQDHVVRGAPASVASGGTSGGVERNWTGMTESSGDQVVDSMERTRVTAVVAALNRFEDALPSDMKTTDRINLQFALRDARERLLISVWDAAAWGDVAAFRAWVAANEPIPPAPEIAEAVRLYYQGRPDSRP
jgi:hypothetical protein